MSCRCSTTPIRNSQRPAPHRRQRTLQPRGLGSSFIGIDQTTPGGTVSLFALSVSVDVMATGHRFRAEVLSRSMTSRRLASEVEAVEVVYQGSRGAETTRRRSSQGPRSSADGQACSARRPSWCSFPRSTTAAERAAKALLNEHDILREAVAAVVASLMDAEIGARSRRSQGARRRLRGPRARSPGGDWARHRRDRIGGVLDRLPALAQRTRPDGGLPVAHWSKLRSTNPFRVYRNRTSTRRCRSVSGMASHTYRRPRSGRVPNATIAAAPHAHDSLYVVAT
jgi:hypothetical protein